MKLHELQDRIGELARTHGNVDVVLIDPTQEVTATSARWTSAIGLFATDAATDDEGNTATVVLIIPNPQNARTVNADGETVAVFPHGA